MKIVVALALITLVLSSLVGCGTSAPEATPSPEPTPSLEARFIADPTTGQVPVQVQFSDLSQGNISSWEWDFHNDGVVDSTIQNPQHIYITPGNYTVSLTVSGPTGNDTEVKVDYLRFTTASCQPDFIAEPTSVRGIRPVQFTDQSTGNITGWAWDFENDGIIDSTEQNPTHTYRENGSYSVTLTVFTPDCRHTLTKYDYIGVSGCHT